MKRQGIFLVLAVVMIIAIGTLFVYHSADAQRIWAWLMGGDAGLAVDKKVALDPRDVGLPWYWLVFGLGAQSVFMSRMVVQWIASERAKASVVPVAFWWLSLVGGLTLAIYFARRGDPVGLAGQLFGCFVYLRNLVFIQRSQSPVVDPPAPATPPASAALAPVTEPPADDTNQGGEPDTPAEP